MASLEQNSRVRGHMQGSGECIFVYCVCIGLKDGTVKAYYDVNMTYTTVFIFGGHVFFACVL